MTDPESSKSQEPLSFREVKAQIEDSQKTILLIHGACASGDEWDLVTPFLPKSYQLLLPDLPGHGNSKDIRPFSKQLSACLLADLIRQKAVNGKAHVVGFSLGSHVAIELASKFPDVVEAVLLSGYGVFPPTQIFPYGFWLEGRIESIMPKSIVRWLLDGTDVQSSNSRSLQLSKEISQTLCFGDNDWPSPWPAKTVIIAAGKGGMLPTSDSPEDARRLRDIERKTNPDTKAYTHPDMRHPWNRQAPELFARTATQWFEEGTILEGFHEL